MDKLKLLKERRNKLLNATENLRNAIDKIVDEKSFVEMDSYSFSHSDVYDQDVAGEGVITGFATIGGYPFHIVAQNPDVLGGSVSLANCRKIVKCLKRASERGVPVLYVLDSEGVRVGENVDVLEGMAEVLLESESLGNFTFSYVRGKLYGSMALLAASTHFSFMKKGSLVCYTSPVVLSSKEKNVPPVDEVAGAASAKYNNIASFEVEDELELREHILKINSILMPEEMSSDDYNRDCPVLDEACNASNIIEHVFDKDASVELNSFCEPDVKTVIARLGDYSVASIVFDGGEEGVELNLQKVLKINDFLSFVEEHGLPLLLFVNNLGIKSELSVSNTMILKALKDTSNYLGRLRTISVIYGKAVGLGYILFASKGLGRKYVFAFPDAVVGLFAGKMSSIAYGKIDETKLAEMEKKYNDEFADPMNAAKNGYVDNIIEPAHVRSYLLAVLQMVED